MSKVRPQDSAEPGEDEEVEYVRTLPPSAFLADRPALACSADSEFYAIRHEKSRIMHDKEALQVVYEDLVEQFNLLKDEHVRSFPPFSALLALLFKRY